MFRYTVGKGKSKFNPPKNNKRPANGSESGSEGDTWGKQPKKLKHHNDSENDSEVDASKEDNYGTQYTAPGSTNTTVHEMGKDAVTKQNRILPTKIPLGPLRNSNSNNSVYRDVRIVFSGTPKNLMAELKEKIKILGGEYLQPHSPLPLSIDIL
jgi:hypothetical protein